jgi:hypothetical protein
VRRPARVSDLLLDHAVEGHDLIACRLGRRLWSGNRLNGRSRARRWVGRCLDDIEWPDRRQKLVQLVQRDIIFVSLELPLDVLAQRTPQLPKAMLAGWGEESIRSRPICYTPNSRSAAGVPGRGPVPGTTSFETLQATGSLFARGSP